ncbi:MAG: zinc ribbon domain-containing protein YjdM [Actinomycetes bacterium]
MTDALPACPRCASEYVYELGDLLVCPECAHEWSPSEEADAAAAAAIRDVNGTVLEDGDDVVIAKDLKVKGAGGGTIKVGTKVRGIRLIQGVGDHDLEAKVDGFGSMQLKSSVVRKA